MSEMLLLSVSIYLINSVLSGVYTRSFLKEKYKKELIFVTWSVAYFLVQIVVFEILNSKFPVGEVAGIILNICVLLFMQFLFFEKDVQKQVFVTFSFIAGKQIVKYIVSVLNVIFTGLWNEVFNFLLSKNTFNTLDKLHIGIDIYIAVIVIICALFYAVLLSAYLFSINRWFVKKCLRHFSPLAPTHGGFRGFFLSHFPS